MYRKLRDIPEYSGGNIDGVDFEADIPVKLTTNEKLRADVMHFINGDEGYEKVDTISPDKTYRIFKITSYGDPFDVWIINDKGEEESFGEWWFEDID